MWFVFSTFIACFSLVQSKESPNTEEWLQLPLASVQSYLAADDLEVRTEQVVLGACLSWVAHDLEKRLAELPGLLHLVRLHHLPPHVLRACIDSTNSPVRVSYQWYLFCGPSPQFLDIFHHTSFGLKRRLC